MTCIDIVTYATEVTGDMSSEAQDFARRALKLKYSTLYNSHNWREAQRTIEGIQLDSTLNGVVFLPFDADEVISLSLSYDGVSYTRLAYRERDWIERFNVPGFSFPGSTPWFYKAENLAWPYIGANILTFTTSESVPFSLYIGGRDANNFPVSENFILQGINNPDGTTSAVNTTTKNVYRTVTSISKGEITTPLLISDGTRTYSMPGGSTELSFSQLVLYPAPLFTNPDGTLLNVYLRIHAKLKPDPLSSDMSVPRISHIWEALVTFTKGACYERMQQVAKAQAMDQIAMALVQAAVNVEKNQAEFYQQVVPTVYEQGQLEPSSINPFNY